MDVGLHLYLDMLRLSNKNLTRNRLKNLHNRDYNGSGLDLLNDYEFDLKNFTFDVTDWHNVDSIHNPVVRIIIIIIYIIVIFTGLIGNAGVLFVFARSKRLHTTTNIFIINLALADIWLAVFSLPVQLHYQLTNTWIFGNLLCRIVFSAFAVPMYVSTISILLIAIDRYRQILYPLRPRFSARKAVSLITIAILVSITNSIPVVHYSKLLVHVDRQLDIHWSYCVEDWPKSSMHLRRAYSIVVFLVQFLLPLTVTGYLYSRVYARLKLRQTGLQTRATKTNRLLVAMVVNFCLCWLPWNIFSLLTEFNPDAVGGMYFRLTDLLLKAFAMGSSCANPFLYSWLNDNFRNELASLAIQLKIYRKTGVGVTADLKSGVLSGRYFKPSTCRRGGSIYMAMETNNTNNLTVERTEGYMNERRLYDEETVRCTSIE